MSYDDPNARSEFILLLDQRLERILGCPGGWGGIEALEPLVLTLLMLRASAVDPAIDERAVLRKYRRFLGERVGPGAADLMTRLGSDATEEKMIEILREYAEREQATPGDLRRSQLPEPPSERQIAGGKVIDISQPHLPRRAS
jgi:hypothetical protein